MDGSGLARDVDLLWGLREAPRRGPRPALSVDDVVRAAVEVADADGLAAVSMARVAEQLGNSTMALYRHVRSKDELLALMADTAVGRPPAVPADLGWREGLALWARALLDAVGRHPWYARLAISGPPVGPGNLAWLDAALAALAGTGLDEGEKLGIVMGVLTYTHGQIRLGLDLTAGHAQDPSAFGREYGAQLARVVDADRLPALHRAVDAGVFAGGPPDLEFADDLRADFEFGLDLLLDGAAAHIARRAPDQASKDAR